MPWPSQISRSPSRKTCGAGHEAALALHGLDDDRRDLFARDLGDEEVAQRRERLSAAGPR